MENMVQEQSKFGRIIRQAIPNLFTVGSIICGLSALLIFHDPSEAGYQEMLAMGLVMLAMLLDFLDGRTARLIKGSSNFGAQMDSLADMVSFGVVPAFIVMIPHQCWVPPDNLIVADGYAGLRFVVGICYAVAVAIRLARFNCRLEVADKNYFEGLPCPASAGLVVIWWVVGRLVGVKDVNDTAKVLEVGSLFLAALSSILMVSNIPFYNFKHVHWTPFKKGVLWTVLLALGAVFLALGLFFTPLAIIPVLPIIIFVGLSLYILVSLIVWLLRCFIRLQCKCKRDVA